MSTPAAAGTAAEGAAGAASDIWSRADGRSTLPAVRELWSQRGGAATKRDLAFLVYLVVLTIAVFGIPRAGTVARGLARPDVLPVLQADDAGALFSGGWLAACGLLVLLGSLRGPALLSPFFTATLASSAMARRRPLLWPQVRAAGMLFLVGAVIGLLVAGTLHVSGHASAMQVLTFSLAVAGAGLLAHGAWSAGQLLRAGPRRVLATLLVLLAGASVISPIRGGLGAVYPAAIAPSTASGATEEAGVFWAVALLVAGGIILLFSLVFLDRIRGEVLLQQAARWESATVGASTGDLGLTAAAFRAVPSLGRRWATVRIPAAGRLTLPLLYLRKDLLSLGRTPERLVTGVLTIVVASAMMVLAVPATGPLRWLGLILAGIAAWSATGAVTDGIRHAVATLGAPALLGQSARSQVWLHLPAPLVVLELAAGLGAGAAILAGAPAEGLVPVLVLMVILLAGRARDAAKGPMPLQLAVPVPTPMGDPSILGMLLWQGDALLLAVLSAMAVGGLAPLGPLWFLGACLALLLVLGIGFHLRMKELSA